MVTGHTSTPDQLIDAAAAIAESEGFGALSVRRLATEVGASRQVVYTHFGGMNGLLDALHVRATTLLAADVAALPGPLGSDENLLAAAHAYVQGARQRPNLFSLTFGRPIPHYTPSADATAFARRFFLDHIVGIIQAWLVNLGQDHTAPQAISLARVFWSALHGLVVIEQAGHATEPETDELVAQTVGLLFEGWRSSSA